MKTVRKQGLTLIELTVVLLIVSILSSIAIGVYTTFTVRARVARAHHEINELSLSITRYETDLGVFPPSLSTSSATAGFTFGQIPGNGLLMLALTRGIVGNAAGTLTGAITTEPLWHGPYMEVNQAQELDYLRFASGASVTSGTSITVATLPGDVCLADPWGRPYSYVSSAQSLPQSFTANQTDYVTAAATLIVNSPFTGYYNPSTYQIYSAGPDGKTLASPKAGLGVDDINNYNSQ